MFYLKQGGTSQNISLSTIYRLTKEFLFHAIARALLQKVGGPKTEGELLVSLEQTGAPASGKEFPELLWDEVQEGLKEGVKPRLLFSYFGGLLFSQKWFKVKSTIPPPQTLPLTPYFFWVKIFNVLK